MEVKNFSINLKKIQTIMSSEMADKVIFASLSFLLALLTTRGLAFGKYAPFAVAFVAAVPKPTLSLAVIGACLGYLLPSPVYIPFRYIVAVLATAAIRWALSELTRINRNQLFAPIVTFVPLLATGITVVLINEKLSSSSALFVAEAFFASGVAYFFNRTMKIIFEKRSSTVFSNIDIACFSVSIGIAILSFNEVLVFGFSIGRILMVLLVLICSGSGGISGGAISGVAAGAIGGLSGLGVSYLSGAYGLGGLMSGIFSSISKLFGVLSFVIAHGVASIQIGDNFGVINAAVEVAIASVTYMLLPQSRRINNIFSVKKTSLSGDSLRNNIILRLNHSSKALTSVAGSVDEISRKLAMGNKVKASFVFNQASAETCAACALRAVCWRKNKDESVSALSSLMPYLKTRGYVESTDFSENFINRCSRIGELKNSINKFYKSYLEKQLAEVRAANVRDIASEQFKVTSAMLCDMASEISLYESFDSEAANRVTEVLRKMNASPIEVCCRIDKYQRMTIEAEIEKSKSIKINKSNLVKEVSRCCGRAFSMPCISNTEFSYKLQMCQSPLLDVAVSISQESADNLCGDSAIGFYDGKGKYISIVSDGMGTGGMAAVDGAMASSIIESLLKAGIGYDTSLRMVNSALMSKSEEETLATVDISTLDLHTGKCEFRKAGGTASFIRKGKKVYAIEEDSLPVGIMPEVRFSLSLEQLKKGDIIVMLSDGVTGCGMDWIYECIKDFEGNDPKELSEEIVYCAKKNRKDGHMDDITAMVIIVSSNKPKNITD